MALRVVVICGQEMEQAKTRKASCCLTTGSSLASFIRGVSNRTMEAEARFRWLRGEGADRSWGLSFEGLLVNGMKEGQSCVGKWWGT
jgi:hypothetical protein